jgi:hypothetical protein
MIDSLVNSWVVKVDLNDHFELSPPSLADLIRRLRNYPIWILVALMELEVDFLNISLHIFVQVRSDVDSPFVSVSILLAFLAKCPRNISINDRLHFSHSLQENQ